MQAANGLPIIEVELSKIIRPIQPTINENKVCSLMKSIDEIGLQVPIPVVKAPNGKLYSFGGCHRYESHKRLNKKTVLCQVQEFTDLQMKLHMGTSWDAE